MERTNFGVFAQALFRSIALVVSSEYKCTRCEHDFDRIFGMDEGVRCPRCGSESVEHNPYLLGTCNVDGLTPEDYFAIALKP